MALDTAQGAGEPVTRQLASAFECALMDIWSQVSYTPRFPSLPYGCS
jgi:hypothetical protein